VIVETCLDLRKGRVKRHAVSMLSKVYTVACFPLSLFTIL
jgi:hypothetical protein